MMRGVYNLRPCRRSRARRCIRQLLPRRHAEGRGHVDGPTRLGRYPRLLYDLDHVDHLARVVYEGLPFQDGFDEAQQRRGVVRPGRVQAGYIQSCHPATLVVQSSLYRRSLSTWSPPQTDNTPSVPNNSMEGDSLAIIT